ncbi:MAG: hypothetical protein LUH57_05700 [Ruminococcus sp.]|nr:hypothetical protein [Ruminococcus sp.]
MSSENLISIYHTAFIVCLAFCILFFVLSIVMFFAFDIKRIYGILTGRVRKKTIEEMTQQTEQTGRLLKNARKGSQSASFSNKLDKIRNDINAPPESSHVEPISTAYKPPEPVPYQDPQQDMQTTLLDIGADQTTLLEENTAKADLGQETTDSLPKNSGEKPQESAKDKAFTPVNFEIGEGHTMQLSSNMIKEAKPRNVKFVIVKENLLTHTEERIDLNQQ